MVRERGHSASPCYQWIRRQGERIRLSPRFRGDGKPLGVFSEDRRIVDPRGLAVEQKQQVLFLNSIDRVLALDAAGKVVRDDGLTNRLNPGLDWKGLKCCSMVRRLS